MLANTLALLTLAATALASISITNPVASSSFKAGQTLKVSWLADKDTATPLAKSFGNSTVSIYTGSATVQTLLQTIGTVDPYKTKSVSTKIDAKMGPSAALYFIRIESLAAKDASGAPLEAFSARFTLKQMTGQWTAAEASANSEVEVATSTGKAAAAASTGAKNSTATKSVSVVANTASVVPIKVATTSSIASSAALTGSSALASASKAANATSSSVASGAEGSFAPLGWKVVVALTGVAGAMMFL